MNKTAKQQQGLNNLVMHKGKSVCSDNWCVELFLSHASHKHNKHHRDVRCIQKVNIQTHSKHDTAKCIKSEDIRWQWMGPAEKCPYMTDMYSGRNHPYHLYCCRSQCTAVLGEGPNKITFSLTAKHMQSESTTWGWV